MPQATAPIFGIVGSFTFRIMADEDQEPDEREDYLYDYALRHQKRIKKLIRDEVAETLGKDFEVVGLRIQRGSIDIRFMLDSAMWIYVTISQFDDFMKGVDRLTHGLRRKFGELFGDAFNAGAPNNSDVIVEGAWHPSVLVMEARRSLTTQTQPFFNVWFMIYLMFTNTALLAYFFWLFARQLK